jgi:hypothetical protein
MAKIVNLRLARKRKERKTDEAAAAENRVRHGASRAERAGEVKRREAETKRLDGHEVER